MNMDCIWFGSYPQREVVENANTYTAIDENYYNQQTDVIEDALYLKNWKMPVDGVTTRLY